MLVGIASELQIRPKCKCNFEGENVNRVAGGEGGDAETLGRLKLIRSLPAVKFQLVVRVKIIIAKANGVLFPLLFRTIVT